MPPPDGVTREQLLNQANWWWPADHGGPKLLTELTPEHRAALKKWLVRTAPKFDEAEFERSVHLLPGDVVFDSFFYIKTPQESRREMKRRPLYQELKKLVKEDRASGVLPPK